MHKNFLDFIDKLNVEDSLLEAILDGYKTIFFESINAWSVAGPTYTTAINEPMGSYQNIMKQLPSSIGAVGGSGDSTRTANNGYSYYASLPGSSRDIKEETMEEWEEAPKFKKIKKPMGKNVKKLIQRANSHIPDIESSMYAPTNYYDNFHMGMYDVDTRRPPF